jgi:MFS family permease
MPPLNWKRTFVVGFGFLGISIIWPIFNNFVPIFLQAGNPEYNQQLVEAGRQIPRVVGFGLSPALAFFIMTWDNLINVFIQPWAGERSDRTWNRFGRRKPWILIGAPIAAIAFVLVPLANTLLAIMVFILITNFGMALFRSPTVAWLGDLFPAEQRSKANGVINLMGGVGAAIALFAGGMLFDQLGRAAPFIFGALLMAAALSVALLGVKEPEKAGLEKEDTGAGVLNNLRLVWRNPDKSGVFILLAILFWFMAFNAVETGLSSFAVFSLGMTPGRASLYTTLFAGTLILFAIPSGLLATRYGRRPIILIGLSALVILFLVGYLFVRNEMLFALLLILAGAAWALVNINSLPMVYDVGDERRIGAFTGLYYVSSQVAAVLGPTLAGVLVETAGNQPRVTFLFSAVFMLLAWLAMSRVRPHVGAPQSA